MHLHVVGGFLGSGKTTAIAAASKLLTEQGTKVGVVANDQGKYLVDSHFFKANRISAGQVVNGCFCCNYNQLDEQINQLRERHGAQVIFAESVGSCTDLIATVIKPLSVFKKAEAEKLSLSIFADAALLFDFLQSGYSPFSDDIAYIYSKQVEEAEILIVNKTDLLLPEKLEELKQLVQSKFQDKTVWFQNSLDRESVKKWLEILNLHSEKSIHSRKAPEIDYRRYGNGEADLAWFDQEIKISSVAGDAADLGKQIAARILMETERRLWTIGHLKFIIEANGAAEKVSFTTNTERRDLEKLTFNKASEALLIINARVETDPESLLQMVAEVVQSVRSETQASVLEINTSSFKPGFPNPTYRMTDVQ